MSDPGFIHLRVRSAFSLSEGAIKIEKLVGLAVKNAMPAVAITDRNNLFGALEFSQYAAKAGVQPIIGCDLGIRREEEGGFGAGGRALPSDGLLLLVQSEQGYRNLLHLVSQAWLAGPTGEAAQIAFADLHGHCDGLIAVSGGPGTALSRLAAEGQPDAMAALAQRLSALFPGRFYVEIERHGMDVERRAEPLLLDLAYKAQLPLLATNDAQFIDRAMFEAHDVLLCIAQGAHVSDTSRRRLTPEHYFKSADEMRKVFADLPEAVDNTVAVARRCAFMPTTVKPILPTYTKLQGRSEKEALHDLARQGMEKLIADKRIAEDIDVQKYYDRLDYELAMIERMGFAGYFLIVADFIQWAKAHDIPVGPGRGSGAGSVAAWSLGITDLDPLRWGLLFERFLNPERVSMPDFDVDFCQDRRDEVIKYVRHEYGDDRVAQIITFGKLQARAVLRDVGRVLGMPYGQVDRICKLVPNNPAKPVTLEQAIDSEPLLQEQIKGDESVRKLTEIALKLEGLYRHASTHAAGVVIGDRPLEELVPLYRDARSSMPATQFNMKYVEQAGLVKFDFLGLKTLTVLDRAVDLIGRDKIDLGKIPLDDEPTYQMLTRGDSTGVFQLEGSGMRDILRKLKPNRFEDIIALVALYRPGPMDDIPKYISVKNGAEPADYLHPLLKDILEETYGIMVYQEQVMQIAQVLSGYSLGGADLLRRAMGKKIQAEMDAQRAAFVEGAIANKVEKNTASMIFDKVAKFAGYGFNKCHSAPYALVAYQTAYLKANYPVEFFAASMTLDMGNTDKLNLFRRELDRLKIPLLGPDINRSREIFAVETTPEGTKAIRYALSAVRNVGRAAMSGLVAERERGDRFKDVFDLARRLDTHILNKRLLESLVKAGALDCLNANRAQTYVAVETLLKIAGAAAEDRNSNQVSLFGDGAEPARQALPALRDWGMMEKLQHEFEAIGFYFSSHPLESFGKSLGRLGVVRAAELPSLLTSSSRGESRVKLAGTLIDKQERTSARGNRFAFVQLSDQSGTYEVMIFSELLSSRRDLLQPGTALLISADARMDGDMVKMTGQSIESLDKALANTTAGLRIVIKEPDALEPLRQAIAGLKGRGRVTLALDLDSQEVEMALPGGYNVPPTVRQKLADLPGVVQVEEV